MLILAVALAVSVPVLLAVLALIERWIQSPAPPLPGTRQNPRHRVGTPR